MKYSAKEILVAAGFNPDEVFGKYSARIGGLIVSKPDHLVNLQGATSVDVMVAGETKTANLTATEQSEEVNTILKQKGDASTADANALAERKANATDEAPSEE